MKIAICEDDKNILEYIRNKVITYLGSKYRVYCFANIAALNSSRDYYEFDIYLLDIELGDGSGFEYAKMIRGTNKKCKIAFITEHENYAPIGYQYNINGYIVKPINPGEIESLLDKLISDIKHEFKPIKIIENYKELVINIDEIEYIEKSGRKSVIYTHICNYEVNESISSLLKRINNKSFFRVNRSLAVNISNIVNMVKDLSVRIQLNNYTIKLSDNDFRLLNEYRIRRTGDSI